MQAWVPQQVFSNQNQRDTAATAVLYKPELRKVNMAFVRRVRCTEVVEVQFPKTE